MTDVGTIPYLQRRIGDLALEEVNRPCNKHDNDAENREYIRGSHWDHPIESDETGLNENAKGEDVALKVLLRPEPTGDPDGPIPTFACCPHCVDNEVCRKCGRWNGIPSYYKKPLLCPFCDVVLGAEHQNRCRYARKI